MGVASLGLDISDLAVEFNLGSGKPKALMRN